MNQEKTPIDKLLVDIVAGKTESNPNGPVFAEIQGVLTQDYPDEAADTETVFSRLSWLIEEGVVEKVFPPEPVGHPGPEHFEFRYRAVDLDKSARSLEIPELLTLLEIQ